MSQNSNTSFKPHKNASKVHSLVSSLILALILFIVLMGCFELIARTNQFKQRFPLRSVGSYHSQFEIKWFKLQDFEERYGGVDVILLGNSMINTGIDAEILAQDYLSATGINLRIFNFGIEGLTVAPNADLAKILMQEFNPGSIIFVTEMRDYVAKNGLSVSQKFLSNPWIQEKLGQPVTLNSWLRVNSHAAQYLLPYRNWSRFDFLDNVFMSTKRISDTTASGYEADRNLGENVDKHPDPNDPNEAANSSFIRISPSTPEG